MIQAYNVELTIAEKIILQQEVAGQLRQIVVQVNTHKSITFPYPSICRKENISKGTLLKRLMLNILSR